MKDKTNSKVKDNIDSKKRISASLEYEYRKLPIIWFIPLLLIAGFVPLITYAKYIDLTGTVQSLYWTGQQQYLDFFSYWKSRWVVILTAISMIIYIVQLMKKKMPLKDLKQYYIPLGIYALFVIISTVFAIDKPTALWGFVDMEQGMFVLLSYIAITFLTINFVNNERDVRLFVRAFLFLMIVEGILGVGQYFGHDFFQTGFGKSLIVPGNIKVDNLSFSFGPKTIYGTLFNTNFVGSFATLMLPLSIGILLGSKTTKQRIISGLAVVLMIFIWIGCNSRAGYLGVAVSAVFALWLFRKVIIRYWKGAVGLALALIVLLIGLNYASDGAVFNRIKTFNIASEIENMKKHDEKSLYFKDIKLGKDNFSIVTDKSVLNFKIDRDKLYFLDENNNELNITKKNNIITINDEKYRNYQIIIPEDYPGVRVYEPWTGKTLNFYISQEGVKVLGSGGRITEPVVAERFKPFDGLENIASDRGYIWSRTIPMIKAHIIIGCGADNYPITFSQDDFVAKLNTGMDSNMVIDKPHNMYLQIAINTGFISLLSLFMLYGAYIISSLKLYSKINYDSLDKYIGTSCLIGVIGFLVAGMFNDSLVSVAPVFWIILGLGISINIRLKNKIS